MTFGFASYGFGLLAGALSTLSPCVLPVVPILLGSAANAHRWAPLTLAAGLAISYASIGAALAWAGASLGIDTAIFRALAAALLGLLGVVLISNRSQQQFASITAGVGGVGYRLLSRISCDGLWGQFAIGLLLGVVWSPCVGPTLGAAIVLASQGTNLLEVAALMGTFGIGAALPIVVLGMLSRQAIIKVRGRLMQSGQIGKKLLGVALILVALLILAGADKSLEAWVVEHSPPWLTELTTRY